MLIVVRKSGAHVLGFDRLHLIEPPRESALFGLKHGANKGVDKLKRQRRADDSRAQHQHVHVIVLHALVRGVGVMTDAGAHAGNFICRDAHAHARSTDDDAARSHTRFDSLAHLLAEVGVIVFRLADKSSQVDDLMASGGKVFAQLFFERKPGVIRCNDELQRSTPSESAYFSSAFARAATFSAVNPSSFITVGPGAEAPKRSSPITSPFEPTYFHQPSVAPASTANLGTPAGSTLALYSADCASKSFQLGKLTTRARMPSAASSLAASTAGQTSEPVPIKITCGSAASSKI